jgi:acylaminoacyl-peptidase
MHVNMSSSHGYLEKKRGTPGFGEEALQSLPGKVGSQVRTPVKFRAFALHDFFFSSKSLTYPKQDVQDCLTAIDHVINEKLIDASKVAVVGISHGGFLTTHLIGQVGILIDSSHCSCSFCSCS